MKCIFAEIMTGKCTLCSESPLNYPQDYGVDEDGYCIVQEDPNPEDNCDSFESDEDNNEV